MYITSVLWLLGYSIHEVTERLFAEFFILILTQVILFHEKKNICNEYFRDF